MEAELPLAGDGVLFQNVRARDVRGHQIGGELDAAGPQLNDLPQRFDHEGLGQTRHADQQAMPASKQSHQHFVEHFLLTHDHLADLGQDSLPGPVELGHRVPGCLERNPRSRGGCRRGGHHGGLGRGFCRGDHRFQCRRRLGGSRRSNGDRRDDRRRLRLGWLLNDRRRRGWRWRHRRRDRDGDCGRSGRVVRAEITLHVPQPENHAVFEGEALDPLALVNDAVAAVLIDQGIELIIAPHHRMTPGERLVHHAHVILLGPPDASEIREFKPVFLLVQDVGESGHGRRSDHRQVEHKHVNEPAPRRMVWRPGGAAEGTALWRPRFQWVMA